jgi:hypothetical protein
VTPEKKPGRNTIHLPADWICKRHRSRLPLALLGIGGAVVLQVTLFQAVSSDERILRRQGWKPESEGGSQKADGSSLDLLVNEVAPWCCFLKVEEYILALDWAVRVRKDRKPVQHEEWFQILEAHRGKAA